MCLYAFHECVLLEEVVCLSRSLSDSMWGAALITEGRKRVIHMLADGIMEGRKRIEWRGGNAGLVHGLTIRRSDLVHLSEQLGIPGEEGAESSNGKFEVRLVQERYKWLILNVTVRSH